MIACDFILSESDSTTENAGTDAEPLKSQDDVIALKIGPEVVELKAGIVQKWKRGSYQSKCLAKETTENLVYYKLNRTPLIFRF